MLAPSIVIPLACVAWSAIQETTPPDKVVQACPGERIRMVRVSQNRSERGSQTYRAVLVVRQDDTVEVKTTRHQGQLKLNPAQKLDLEEALASFLTFRKKLLRRRPQPMFPSREGGIDFYIDVRSGNGSLRWTNTLYEQPDSIPPLFDVLEVYQYLLRPKSDD